MRILVRIVFMLVIMGVLFITYPSASEFSSDVIETMFVYQDDTQLLISTEEDTIDYIDSNSNNWANVSTESTKTIVNFGENQDELKNLELQANEKVVDAYKVVIDDNYEFYISDKDLLTQASNNVMSVFLSEAAYQAYLQTGNVPSFVKDGKSYSDFYIASDIVITEGSYPENKVLTDVDSVNYYLVNGYANPQYATITDNTTIDSILNEYNLTENEFYLNNPNLSENSLFYNNQQVIVNKPDLAIELLGFYDSVEERSIAYQEFEEQSLDLFIGQREVKQEGSDGVEELTYKNQEINGQLIEQSIVDNTVVVMPTNQIVTVGTHEIPDVGTGTFIWPESCNTVTNGYWGYYMHEALDIQCGYGMPEYAADNGVVIVNEFMAGGYGNYVIIDHNNGFKTLYGHMAQPSPIPVGTVVQKGQVIGNEGSTGNSTGHHLHFEIQLVDENGKVLSKPTPENYYTIDSNGNRQGKYYLD